VLLAIAVASIGPHFHSVVRNPEARAVLVRRLSTTSARDSDHDYLRWGLRWLDDRIGPPPFGRHDPDGPRVGGLISLGWCITLLLVYSIGSYLIGWVTSTPGAFGQVTLMDVRWSPVWVRTGCRSFSPPS